MLDDRTHNKHTRVQITNPLELFPWQVRLLLYRLCNKDGYIFLTFFPMVSFQISLVEYLQRIFEK